MSQIAAEPKKRSESSVFHIRPARRGDICILLESTDETEIAQMRRQQRALQAMFGGVPVEPVHLTCQRFEVPGEGRSLSEISSNVHEFIHDFAACIMDVTPFSFTALSLQTLYVPALRSNMLKWQVRKTNALRHFVALAGRELARAGLVSLYVPGAIASLVTALKGVPMLTSEDFAQVNEFPYHLFTANRVVLSRIRGPDDFEILATFALT
jgi:hypothetical protein